MPSCIVVVFFYLFIYQSPEFVEKVLKLHDQNKLVINLLVAVHLTPPLLVGGQGV